MTNMWDGAMVEITEGFQSLTGVEEYCDCAAEEGRTDGDQDRVSIPYRG